MACTNHIPLSPLPSPLSGVPHGRDVGKAVACSHVPHATRVICAARDNSGALKVDADAGELALMSDECVQTLPAARVPQNGRVIKGG